MSRTILILFCMLPSVAHAVEKPLTGSPLEWGGGAGGKSAVKIVSQAPLEVEVSVGGGAEGFPRVHLAPPRSWDLRAYVKITGEVRLESADPGVKRGGKDIVFCLSDNGLRNESMEGRPEVQQRLSAHVKAGDWQPVSVNLAPMVRSQCDGLSIYLYDAPYNYPHSYKISFRNLRLIAPDPAQTQFDGVSYATHALAGSADGEAGTLKTEDGLTMVLAKNGGILKLLNGNAEIGDGTHQVSGILLRDARTDHPPVMAGGTVTATPRGWRQVADRPEMKLKLDAAFRADRNRFVLDGRIESTSDDDRAITVYWALPISTGAWEWHRTLNESVRPFDEMKEVPSVEETTGSLPLAVLSDRAGQRGIALILDQGRPVLYRLAVNPREHLLYAAFDFGLVDQRSADGRNLRAAEFHLEMTCTDPNWGFRSGVQKLYALHPEHVVDRVGHGGGWEIGGGRAQANETENDRAAAGFRFDWSGVDNDRDLWEWNAKHGIANLIYVEPEFFQFSMGDYPAPTVDDTRQRMDRLLGGDEKEWSAFLPLHYSQAIIGNRHMQKLAPRPVLTYLLQCLAASIMADQDGRPVVGLGYRIGWIGDSGFGAMAPANLAPAIPGGRGTVAIERYLKFFDETIQAQGWTPPAGFGLDCFMSAPNDYRRESFQYVASPLGFDPVTKQPMVPQAFGSVEWLKALRQGFKQREITVMANCFGPVTFAAPQLDVFGLENSQVNDPEFFRVIAGPRRSITFLPYDNPPSQALCDYQLFWCIYPGRNVPAETMKRMTPILDTLYRAGWYPVTGARASLPAGNPIDSPNADAKSVSPGIQVERYGQNEDDKIYLTIYNPGDQSANVRVRLDPNLTGPRVRGRAVYNGADSFTLKNDAFEVSLAAKQTKVLCLER